MRLWAPVGRWAVKAIKPKRGVNQAPAGKLQARTSPLDPVAPSADAAGVGFRLYPVTAGFGGSGGGGSYR